MWQPFPKFPHAKEYGILQRNSITQHYYIAPEEQLSFATDDGQLYRLPKSLFYRRYADTASSVQCVQVGQYLKQDNLYTLSWLDEVNQYNLSGYFTRYEKVYRSALHQVLSYPTGSHQMDLAYRALWHMKLLDIIRNPYTVLLSSGHYLFYCFHKYLQRFNINVHELREQILQRHKDDLQQVMYIFGFSRERYADWLAVLTAILSEGLMQPSLFERVANMWLGHHSIRHCIFRFDKGYCCFPDSTICMQSASSYSWHVMGLPLGQQAFMTVSLDDDIWQKLSDYEIYDTAEVLNFHLIDNDENQRLFYNYQCITQCVNAIYGSGSRIKDYI